MHSQDQGQVMMLQLHQGAALPAISDEIPEDGGHLPQHVAGALRPLPQEYAALSGHRKILHRVEADHVVVAEDLLHLLPFRVRSLEHGGHLLSHRLHGADVHRRQRSLSLIPRQQLQDLVLVLVQLGAVVIDEELLLVLQPLQALERLAEIVKFSQQRLHDLAVGFLGQRILLLRPFRRLLLLRGLLLRGRPGLAGCGLVALQDLPDQSRTGGADQVMLRLKKPAPNLRLLEDLPRQDLRRLRHLELALQEGIHNDHRALDVAVHAQHQHCPFCFQLSDGILATGKAPEPAATQEDAAAGGWHVGHRQELDGVGVAENLLGLQGRRPAIPLGLYPRSGAPVGLRHLYALLAPERHELLAEHVELCRAVVDHQLPLQYQLILRHEPLAAENFPHQRGVDLLPHFLHR
mmetsp:Transcript_6892/g.16357  ORF Transcript_6892/g.16357 Transcript_6892/m.16357 type:complete len:406 (-) Transcript_6892:37-1254(-)